MATASLRRTLGSALLGATLLALLAASPALADSASITFTDAAGTSHPAVGVGRTFSVTGNSAVSKRLYVLFRPAGGRAMRALSQQRRRDDELERVLR